MRATRLPVPITRFWVFDGREGPRRPAVCRPPTCPRQLPLTRVRNKADRFGKPCRPAATYKARPRYSLSAKTGEGMDALREHLKRLVSFEGAGEGDFSARRRHLDAISRAHACFWRDRHALSSKVRPVNFWRRTCVRRRWHCRRSPESSVQTICLVRSSAASVSGNKQAGRNRIFLLGQRPGDCRRNDQPRSSSLIRLLSALICCSSD